MLRLANDGKPEEFTRVKAFEHFPNQLKVLFPEYSDILIVEIIEIMTRPKDWQKEISNYRKFSDHALRADTIRKLGLGYVSKIPNTAGQTQ